MRRDFGCGFFSLTGAFIREGANKLKEELLSLGMTPNGKDTPGKWLDQIHAAAGRRREMDLLAWMTGQYTALALCDPTHYPQSPGFFEKKDMDPEKIKERVRTWAVMMKQ